MPVLLGGLVAFLSGWATLVWLLGHVKRWGLVPFAPYCVALGIVLLLS